MEELQSKIDSVKVSIREHKRLLRNPGCEVDRAARLAVRLNAYEMELDSLMLLKTQHEIMSYIDQGGKPSIKESGDLFEVSIPGSKLSAFVNEDGLEIIKSLMDGISISDEGVCSQDEEQSDTIGESSNNPPQLP